MAKVSPIKVAVVGYGMSAKIFPIPFLLALPSQYTLHGILQRTSTPENSASTNHPTIKIHTSLDILLSDSEPTLIIITTPPSTHYTITHAALSAGKHVLCEKPFVPTSAEARTLGALAVERNLILTVYQNRRWDADFLTLSSLLSEKKLGRIVDIQTHFDRHRPTPPATTATDKVWKTQPGAANGAIYDLGVHLLDQLYVLLGPPARVTAFIGNQREYGPDSAGADAGGDSFTLILQYESGDMATARAGVVSAGTRQLRWWVRRTEGSFWKWGVDVQEEQLKGGVKPPGDEKAGKGYGEEGEEAWGVRTSVNNGGKAREEKVKPEGEPQGYTVFYRRLARAIRKEGEVPVAVEEVAEVLRLIEVAKMSSDEGRTLDFQGP